MNMIKDSFNNLYLSCLGHEFSWKTKTTSRMVCWAVAFLLGLWTWAPACADEIRAEVRTVNGQKEVFYTNAANDSFMHGSTYPTYQGKRRSSSAKKATASKTKTSAARAAKSSATAKAAPQGKRRPDGTYEFAPPQYKVYEVKPRYAYKDDWSFATFDPGKRQPRLVSYYGWDPNDPQQKQRAWVEVDLNPIILKYAKIWGVDPLLVEIVICHESGFNPNAVSPVGAVGLMQLMPATASGLGVYDAFDVEQNIAGGTRYIASQLERFNSVPLALAAYNAGPGAVMQYGGVPPYSETQYYVDTIYGEYLAGKRAREGR